MSFPLPSVSSLLRPRSIAVIGASTTPNKVGGTPITLLKRLGYDGLVVPVHPSAPDIQGLSAVRSILDAPEPIDLAIVCVPQSIAVQAVKECGRAGVKGVIVFTAGFAEAGEAGRLAQDAMVEAARAAGMALLGPNCLGAMSLRQKLFATFSPAALAGTPPLGSIGMVSQSGAFGAYAFTLARQHNVGLSHWVTTGNEGGLGVADVIEWMAHDDETRVIMAYIEGCRDGQRLVRALRAARAAGKPVVVTKVGRTAAGARAALSHTDSLAGEDSVYDAVFEENGAIRALDIDAFFRYGQALAQGRVPALPSVAIVTASGGVGTLMADRCEELGLALPPFTPAEGDVVKALTPLATTANPIDVTGQVVAQPQVQEKACAIAVESGRYGGVALFTAAGALVPSFWPTLLDCARTIGSRPGVAGAVAGIMTSQQRGEMAALGCMVYEEPTHAIEALSVLYRFGQSQRQHAGDNAAPTWPALPGTWQGELNEAEGLRLLMQYGVSAPVWAVAQTAQEAAAAYTELGGPVAAKLLSRDVLHKSDVGGVELNVSSAEAAAAAFERIRLACASRAPQARFEGVLLARMVKPVLECMVGARLDPVFGPVVVFGLGGTEVEWLHRVAIATAPVSPQRVRELLERLGLIERLQGWRGGPRIDPGALIEAVCRVSQLAAAAGERLVSVEVNPLMVTVDQVLACDAVVQLQGEGART